MQVLRIAKFTEMVGLDMMIHNDQPDRNDYDIEMEKTRGGALSNGNFEPREFVPIDLSMAKLSEQGILARIWLQIADKTFLHLTCARLGAAN